MVRKMKNIRILTPIVAGSVFANEQELLECYRPLEAEGLEISARLIPSGPSSIESLWEEFACVPGLVTLARQAELDGVDGLIVDCMGDPGVDVLREIVSIPVLGPAQTTMGLAAMLGRKFAVITVLERTRPLVEDLVRKYGLFDRFCGCEIVELPVLEFGENREHTLDLVIEAAHKAAKSLRADVIVVGCTGWTGLAPHIEKSLADAGYAIPVLDPMMLTVRLLSVLIDSAVTHSKRAYPSPKA